MSPIKVQRAISPIDIHEARAILVPGNPGLIRVDNKNIILQMYVILWSLYIPKEP